MGNDFIALQTLLAGWTNNPKERFDAVWEMVKECGEEERHFNQLQSVYRGIASSWLLATFGAAGYLMYDKGDSLAAGFTCLLGAFGVSLLWILDVHIYHRLLVAVFNEGEALETAFPWLPKLRHNMSTYTSNRVQRRLAWYYLLTACVPFAFGVFMLATSETSYPTYSAPIAFVIGTLYLLGIFRRTTRSDLKAESSQCPFGRVNRVCAWLAGMQARTASNS